MEREAGGNGEEEYPSKRDIPVGERPSQRTIEFRAESICQGRPRAGALPELMDCKSDPMQQSP